VEEGGWGIEIEGGNLGMEASGGGIGLWNGTRIGEDEGCRLGNGRSERGVQLGHRNWIAEEGHWEGGGRRLWG
jgi:hypothetical protein